uniref:Uncharacterized protein n=1 Tax=Cyprinodon variegatus TaxID=28743 RepID=A0A3Q2EGV0_CYPVA
MGSPWQIRVLMLHEKENLERTLFRLEQETGLHWKTGQAPTSRNKG